ncbi:MAG TPA: hypothetical protein VNL18_00380 [Gemmatimonadales bacterium]|nr:hypothetical protein [Gemmatimonadales bacterium]
MSWGRRFLADWPSKVTALALAVLVWALVKAQEPTTQMVPVTLVIDPPAGAEIAGPLPQVRAIYTGRAREIFKLLGSPPRITRIIPDTAAGSTVVLDLSAADLVTTEQARVTVHGVEPRRIHVSLRRAPPDTIPSP